MFHGPLLLLPRLQTDSTWHLGASGSRELQEKLGDILIPSTAFFCKYFLCLACRECMLMSLWRKFATHASIFSRTDNTGWRTVFLYQSCGRRLPDSQAKESRAPGGRKRLYFNKRGLFAETASNITNPPLMLLDRPATTTMMPKRITLACRGAR